jgi:hypothetical protein
MTVHTQPDYRIRSARPAPRGYPSAPVPDSFSEVPFLPDYESRRRAFFDHVLRNPAPENTKPAWHELARLAAGGVPDEGIFEAALDFIDARKDCSDFVLHGFLRMMSDRTLEAGKRLSAGLIAHVKRSILNFKYFPDEPGLDSLCTWTENHYILYASSAYLAGQMYPDELFANSGETGRQKVGKNRPRILRWLDLRFRTGFSEWLSHVYYDEDLAALLALHDFAADEGIRLRAGMVIDLLLLDTALNSFKGVFGSTHGRAYENTKKWASNEGTTDTAKLLFGTGVFSGYDNMSAVAFALSRYRVPQAIEAAAGADHLENRQRMGIRLSEMEKWGLRPDNFEDGMLYLTLEAYLHPRTIANTLRMFDTCNWWQNAFLDAFQPYRRLLKALGAVGGLPLLARFLERDACRNTREEVNLYTYKTPDYMLSTAQDYRPGYGGDQQHIWQATLGQEAVCFTTHPAKIEGVTPSYWAGSGLLPRAAQYRNVAVVVYNIRKIPALYVPVWHFYTHAWLPKDKFDEVVERDNWIFARRGDGYLALRSQHPYFWNEQAAKSEEIVFRKEAEDFGREVIVPGKQNIWVCQMGSKTENGGFREFVEAIAGAEIYFDGLNVRYHAPRMGLVSFGWKGAFSVDGAVIPLGDYPRYDNPYVRADFDPGEIKVTAGGHHLIVKWKTVERSVL